MKNVQRIRELFANAPADWFDDTDARYDTFYPRSSVPVVTTEEGSLRFVTQQWGIMPIWAKKKSDILTNSQSESILEKPTFRTAFLFRRCLMPASNFFESIQVRGQRHNLKFTLKSGKDFCFAGIWQTCLIDGKEIDCCSMLTGEPNKLVGEVHTRMPVILRPAQFDAYLNTPPAQAKALLSILAPYPEEEMQGAFDDTST
jgi:putative SOS response-associated peptidase YedK